MASARVLREVILIPDRTLLIRLDNTHPMPTKRNILCFELIRQNQIRIIDNLLISRDHIIIDIQPALIPHDRVQHCNR